MNNARSYAIALYELVHTHPERGTQYLQNLREALVRRGHQKLLSRIYAEYQKLQIYERRAQQNRTVTPETERMRILLELYQKLIAVK